ncbi:rhodanese-like domain-containing protein [Cysteiniphilum sp. 6C5]|uniref:rhodanese-like domain-containing protein n=1 Tax=unclassified Cysteiniphilum TaxID=2610889 RepID=UPI003F84DCA6
MSYCQTISIDEYNELCQNQCVKLIDIRAPEEYEKEHIKGAINKTLNELNSHVFSEDEIIVFHCQSGHRTRQAEGFFSKLPIKKVYILKGGMSAWKKANLQTVINAKAPFPIMRQVQIIVGFMVVLGIVLSYIISPWFNILSAFFGAGLLFAGLSGTCALANLLMFLPFNKTKNKE